MNTIKLLSGAFDAVSAMQPSSRSHVHVSCAYLYSPDMFMISNTVADRRVCGVCGADVQTYQVTG